MNSTIAKPFITRRHCYLFLAAALTTYLLIVMGGVVCVTDSGQGCPDWPGCYGRVIPPMRMDAIIEYAHRLVAALTSPLIIATAIVGWRKYRSIRWVSRTTATAVVFLLIVVVFGALAVLRGLSPGAAVVDLGLALMVLALTLAAAVVAFAHHGDPSLPDRLSARAPFTRLAWWALLAVFVVLVSGIIVAESGSMVRCVGWPLYSGWLFPVDLRDWLRLARRLIAGAASLMIVALVVQAWRTQRERAPVLRAATAVGVVFLVEMLVGALMLTWGFAISLLVIYVAAAAALWALLVVLAVLSSLAYPAKRE